MTVQTFDIVPLEGQPLGAEVHGVDFRQSFPEGLAKRLKDAMHEHLVLLFRGQAPMSEDEQIAFTEQIGPQEVRVRHGETKARPTTRLVTNVEVDGRIPERDRHHDTEMYFHHDTCFREVPQKGLLLHALKLPPSGGNTLFGNMYNVYEALPQSLKDQLEGQRVLQVFINTSTQRADISKGFDDLQHAIHPAVVQHPVTGRKYLYVNRLMTMRFEDMPEAESDGLLEELFDIAEQPRFLYEHVWQEGDLIFWDNFVVAHARTKMLPDEPRVLRHTSLQGFVTPEA